MIVLFPETMVTKPNVLSFKKKRCWSSRKQQTRTGMSKVLAMVTPEGPWSPQVLGIPLHMQPCKPLSHC